MLLTNFENLNYILYIFRETRDFLVLTDTQLLFVSI